MKKYLLYLSGMFLLMTISLTSFAQTYTPLTYYSNNTPTHGVKIKTNLPYQNQSHMPTLIIEGYNFGQATPIGIMLNWYVYGGEFYAYKAVNYGAYEPTIKLANEDGKVVVFIDDTQYFNRFQVRAFAEGLVEEVAANFEGWEAVDEALTGTNVVTVPYTVSGAGEDDATPDAWEDNGDVVETSNKVRIDNNLILGATKRMGVGIDSPSALVDIKGPPSGYVPGERGLKVEGNFNSYVASAINTSGGSGAGGLLVETSDGNGVANAMKVVTFRGISPQTVFRIPNYGGGFGNRVLLAENGGRVGIGTDTPENELDVCGYVRAKEIIVETNWCDYVFADDYLLPSLSEQKDFIEVNGYLKNFQSEKEMGGEIHVGDIQKRQQQTLEEMMLYLIEMQAEIKELKAEIAVLKAEE